MAPEGFINHSYGLKTDVWAFGVLIFELLHGRPPFANCCSESELFYAMTQPLPASKLRKDLSQELKDVILKCMEIDEKKRANMIELSLMPYFKA
jgi:serine/threonine protein kinase